MNTLKTVINTTDDSYYHTATNQLSYTSHVCGTLKQEENCIN